MPIRITTNLPGGEYIEIVAETNAVNCSFLHYVLDEIEDARLRQPGQYRRLLLEIIAPNMEIDLMEGWGLFRRAIKMGLRGTQVAYLITGRPLSTIATTMEFVALRQGIQLRFFVDRDCAIAWLKASAEESGRVA